MFSKEKGKSHQGNGREDSGILLMQERRGEGNGLYLKKRTQAIHKVNPGGLPADQN